MSNEEQILESIKQLLSIDTSYDYFDMDVTLHINSAFSELHQLGVGPAEGFRITGQTETWADFLGNRNDLDMVKSYVYLFVRLLFDPPSNSFLVSAFESQLERLTWRINMTYELDAPVVVVPIEEGL